MYREYFDSPIGRLEIRAVREGICYCGLIGQEEPSHRAHKIVCPPTFERGGLALDAKRELEQYFRAQRTRFDLPLVFTTGTAFQKRVWSLLTQIPFGSTVTYGELASRLHNPRAARACGSAVGKNPLLLFVPCHRVVAKNGLGGFSAGGEANKRRLLCLERTTIPKKGENRL